MIKKNKSPVEGILVEDFFREMSLGVCIKDLEKKVLYQNEISKSLCDNQSGCVCEKGCMENYQPSIEDVYLEGISKRKVVTNEKHSFEVVVINDGKQILTLQYKLSDKVKKILTKIQEFKLTNKEEEIIKLKILRVSNKVIAANLDIAEATLHTHLNNLYKKLSPELKNLIAQLS